MSANEQEDVAAGSGGADGQPPGPGGATRAAASASGDAAPDMTGHDVSGDAPAEALPQDDALSPDDVEHDQEALAEKGLAGFDPPVDLPPDVRRRVDELAPPPPQGVREQDAERWAMCSRIGAMIALDQLGGDADESELRQAAWHTARAVFNDPQAFPMGSPGEPVGTTAS